MPSPPPPFNLSRLLPCTVLPTSLHFHQQCPASFIDQWYYNFGSCDGMLCFEVNRAVILWNPSIGKSNTLPSLGLGGYPAYGFGFDTSIHNYKVVCVLCNMDNQGVLESSNIMVHTLGSDSWRMILGEFPVPESRSLKLASGALNWFASNDYSIVSFDLVNESYRKLSVPNYGRDVFKVILDVLRDCVCILAHSLIFSCVWMMKEFGNEESWTQLFCISRFFHISMPIWIFEDDQVLMEKSTSLALCDFKNGAIKIQMIPNTENWADPEVYIESLVSPCF